MKKMFFTFLFFLFAVQFTAVAQEQIPVPADWIRLHPGIPIETSLHWHWVWSNFDAVSNMVEAGVDVIHLDMGEIEGEEYYPDYQLDTIADLGLKVIPVMSRESISTPVLNWIRHYTDAKYSVWEAEGNDNYDANLIKNDAKTVEDTDGGVTFIRRRGNVSNSVDTLLWGPYYRQEINYFFSDDGSCDTIGYTAEFSMKLDTNTTYPHNDTTSFRMDDTICIMQVTQSYAKTLDSLGCTYVIKERALTRADFTQLNQFFDFELDPSNPLYDYKLLYDSCQSSSDDYPIENFSIMAETPCDYARRSRQYIQFKVIWNGRSNSQGYPLYLLSVDKVTVYDERGDQLMVSDTTTAEDQIEDQLETLSPTYDGRVTGWLGFDEVQSIDQFATIKKVMEIVDSYSQRERPLWLPFMGRWAGL